MRPLRIFTWHVHGNYLYYLTHTPHEFYLPVGRKAPGYAGAAPGFPWSPRVHNVPVDVHRTTRALRRWRTYTEHKGAHVALHTLVRAPHIKVLEDLFRICPYEIAVECAHSEVTEVPARDTDTV